MADADPTLVVRYRPEAVEHARSVVLPAVRRRALAMLLVALGTAVAITVPTVISAGAADHQGRLLLLGTLVLPGALGVVALRRLMRPPALPDVALTITREHVVFAPREATGLVVRREPAERWDLGTTTARVATGDGASRLEITTTGPGAGASTPRARAFPVDQLDTPAPRILQALRRA